VFSHPLFSIIVLQQVCFLKPYPHRPHHRRPIHRRHIAF
jgi:hypothetical protein